ncbi:ER degradation-enhancing alpha-mannosidase-like protein 1 [Ceratocystis fimbriata CBS 114723]|uniref:alpha-1,2-Mannosidase n=1 Tax=Ceratocystis fimbriata CBS 114723 TaxID=1035309 RepID=A0A2C5W0B2_9PEZI|nr:ER degradation-enhancing alpha-mannosidase-like protein 1 [Ceratocystis fimbriata CBS 114723]
MKTPLPPLLLAVALFQPWISLATCMRQSRIDHLRKGSAEMFYHGYLNYMEHAFPEDELRPISCEPLTRNRSEPWNFGLNDVLGNYSLTLIDSLSTLAILASAPEDGTQIAGSVALRHFHKGVTELVRHYGDGRDGPSGEGLRARGFDLDSKVQVFETVIRGVGGLLSAHLFAIGQLPIRGYEPFPGGEWDTEDPFTTVPVRWAENMVYDGQLLRLAYDLAERLLPAFYTPSGIPYPRVNLRTGIPFYPNSPLHKLRGMDVPKETSNVCDTGSTGGAEDKPEITETCSAGAASLVLEFTTLSRLTGDNRFEQAAKRAFWSIWEKRSSLGLIGNGIDSEQGNWLSQVAGIGAGIDSFFEYALKTHVLLSGQDIPESEFHATPRPPPSRSVSREWLDPSELYIYSPLTSLQNSPEGFLEVWHQAHAAVKRHLYNNYHHPGRDYHHPSYMNVNIETGALAAYWIDSLGAFYPGLLAMAGELEEAVESNLLYTALWSRFSALPERWSLRDGNVEYDIGWWPGRPELIESNYHIYRATQDPWYLHVGEMVIKDIIKNCLTKCGWSGLKDVRTLEKSDRMESFFLGETTKYLYLLFDEDHPLNKLDSAFVFNTEGHPLILPPKRKRPTNPTATKRQSQETLQQAHVAPRKKTPGKRECPVPPQPKLLAGSATAERGDIYHAASQAGLQHTAAQPDRVIHTEDETGQVIMTPANTKEIFPWTLPRGFFPANGTSQRLPDMRMTTLEFPASKEGGSALGDIFPPVNVERIPGSGIRVHTTDKLKLQLVMQPETETTDPVWRVFAVNGLPLGRDETAQLLLPQIIDYNVPLFNVIRNTKQIDITLHFERDAEGESGTRAIVSAYRAAVKNFKSQLTSVLQTFPSDSATPDMPTRWTETLEATTASGSGSGIKGLLTAKSLPVMGSVYMAGLGCSSVLPESVPAEHHVIVFRRGGCTFAEKLANIPPYMQTDEALKLVVVVDENMEDVAIRPHINEAQTLPDGTERKPPVPMILVRSDADSELYDKFQSVWRVTLAKKYYVESRGMRIENLYVVQ